MTTSSDEPRLLIGGCLCGAVRVTVRNVPEDVTVCHCRTCRTLGGGAFMIVVGTRSGALTIEDAEGTLRRYRSGSVTERSFCGRCATPVGFHYDADLSDRVSVFQGLFEAADLPEPDGQVHVRDRLDWTCRLSDIREIADISTLTDRTG